MWKKTMTTSSSSSKSKLLSNLFAAEDEELPMARTNPSDTTIDVDEEYDKALRTQSFLDMFSKFHLDHLRRSISCIVADDDNDDAKCPEFFLKPSQESLAAATAAATTNGRSSAHSLLLLEFFDVTFRAFIACAKLLAAINGARDHHRSIRDLLLKLSSSCSDDCDRTEFDRLACIIQLENPLCSRKLAEFYSLQAEFALLLQRLTRTHRRSLRRAQFLRVTRKAAGMAVIASCSIAVAVRWMRAAPPRARYLERVVAAPVEAAAKGAYITGRDLETVGRLLRRVHDEVEHERGMAGMAVRASELHMVREAARGVESGTVAEEERMGELEEHVCLCLITINRSRSMVAEGMMVG